ncbi:DUF6407 family protein [Bacillaceae bacterium IKA-2]|nr:DUF6407 family protein [Bacillaceae bacterium IKA-2]
MTLKYFVLDIIRKMDDFDAKNSNSIKKVIRIAIEDFRFKTMEKIGDGGNGVLYLASDVEENLLSKIAEFAIDNGEETSIESVYEGHIIVRKY